ncbi:hypothetical protein [Streptomyces sp. SID486]|uniref:hypothetical protein n=1 Tax=Streptomyces sp. SID486 TaxID=2690264 RepID=UPI0019263D96|nr:hypothetical protein [Streptomyces sp. SID486]
MRGQPAEPGERVERADPLESGEEEGQAGTDALMVVITGGPLPPEAQRDPVFLAEHRAAEADVAVLRDRLAWLAEALTEEPRPEPTGEAVAAQTVVAAAETAETAETEGGAAVPGGSAGAAVPGGSAGAAVPGGSAGGGGDVRAGGAGRRSRSRTRPLAAARPGRPGRRRQARRVVLGALAGAAVFAVSLGFGRLVVEGGVTADNGGSAKSAGAMDGDSGTGGRPVDPERELACSRLVVEGTVARVERRKDPSRSRVTLTVSRSYKPAHGPAEVGILLGADARPAPRTGQHVLVAVARGERDAYLWAVGEARVAAGRAWITEALPASRTLPCPSGATP